MFQVKTSYCIHVKIEFITLEVTKEAEKLSKEAIMLSFSTNVSVLLSFGSKVPVLG